MLNCAYCDFKSERVIPLYRMCCEANMIKRCVEITNSRSDSQEDDMSWLNKSEEERKTMTTYRPLAKKAYRCHYDMEILLGKCEEIQWGHRNLDYCVLKIVNKRWNQRNAPQNILYLNIQVLDTGFRFRLLINKISNEHGEECFRNFISAKRGIGRLRKRFRNEQMRRQFENDYAYRQRAQMRETANILMNMRVERSLLNEFDEAAKNSMITKEKAIDATECSICFNDLGETNKMILRCGHQFCGDCIFRHHQCQNGSSCPTCRAQFV